MEEDAEDASNGSADVWDESLEAPFWVIPLKLLKCSLRYFMKVCIPIKGGKLVGKDGGVTGQNV